MKFLSRDLFIFYKYRSWAVRNWRNSIGSIFPSLFRSAARNAAVIGSVPLLLIPLAEALAPPKSAPLNAALPPWDKSELDPYADEKPPSWPDSKPEKLAFPCWPPWSIDDSNDDADAPSSPTVLRPIPPAVSIPEFVLLNSALTDVELAVVPPRLFGGD